MYIQSIDKKKLVWIIIDEKILSRFNSFLQSIALHKNDKHKHFNFQTSTKSHKRNLDDT